ncbi:hypothetical protein HED60_24515 [Planctomycetales bacterium ZRK34]|nr:hypothetical protein HED60_24515 [Planctomycetales bacterium ZRK34]
MNLSKPLMVVAALVLCTAAVLRAESPADLAPADANVYLQLNDLAKLRADWESDPLADYLKQYMPPHHQPQAWQDIQTMLDMNGEQIIDTFFGKTLSLFAVGTGEKPPGLVLSRVDLADSKAAVQKLSLELMGKFGSFELYQPSDGKGRIAISDKWVAMGDPKHDDFIRNTLTHAGKGDTLAANAQFKQWTTKLPNGWVALGFARETDKDEVHTAGLYRNGRDVKLEYAGHSTNFAKVYEKLSDAGAKQFGPLPATTIGAMTLNVHDKSPDPRAVEFFNRILAPRSYEKEVLPKLDAPVVAFLGELKSDQVEPSPGLSVPVVGFALHLKDGSVSADLDRILNSVLVFANLATMQWAVDPIAMTDGEYNGSTYRVADMGKPLSQKAKRPEIAGMVKLTFGRIGEWYVICSHENFFRQCVDAAAGKSTLTAAADFDAIPLKNHNTPVMSGFVRAPLLANHFQTWLDYGKSHYPQVFTDAEQVKPARPAAKAVRGLTVLTGALKHYRSMSLQTYRGEGDTLRGRADIIRQVK